MGITTPRAANISDFSSNVSSFANSNGGGGIGDEWSGGVGRISVEN